jgi:hypothetical protein
LSFIVRVPLSVIHARQRRRPLIGRRRNAPGITDF